MSANVPLYYLGFAETSAELEWQQHHLQTWLSEGFLSGDLPLPAGALHGCRRSDDPSSGRPASVASGSGTPAAKAGGESGQPPRKVLKIEPS